MNRKLPGNLLVGGLVLEAGALTSYAISGLVNSFAIDKYQNALAPGVEPEAARNFAVTADTLAAIGDRLLDGGPILAALGLAAIATGMVVRELA